MKERPQYVPRSGATLVRFPRSGRTGLGAGSSAASGFPALLKAAQRFSADEEANALLGWEWDEAVLDANSGVSIKAGGLNTNPGITTEVTFVEGDTGLEMTQPSDGGELIGTPVGGKLTVRVKWTSPGTATKHWVEVGTAAPWNDIYDSGELGDVEERLVPGCPADKTIFYITLWWYIKEPEEEEGVWYSRRWQVRITAPMSLAVFSGDLNRLRRQTLYSPTERIVLDEPILVRLLRSTIQITDPETEEVTRTGVYVFDQFPDEGFLGQVVEAGPEAQEDYDDARYWVREVYNQASSPTDPLSFAVAAFGRWVTAHHLVEHGVGTDDLGVHGVIKAVTGKTVPARYVWVERRYLSGQLLWVIRDTYPGQMLEDEYAYLATSIDEDGCVDVGAWYKTTGPAITAQEDPPEEDPE